MGPWMAVDAYSLEGFGLYANSHHFDEKQVPDQDPHQRENSEPNPHPSEKSDPIRIKVKRQIRIRIKVKSKSASASTLHIPVDDGKLGEALQGLLGPGAPERPVPVPVPGYDPGGGVAHLVDQGVPQSIPAVYHLANAK